MVSALRVKVPGNQTLPKSLGDSEPGKRTPPAPATTAGVLVPGRWVSELTGRAVRALFGRRVLEFLRRSFTQNPLWAKEFLSSRGEETTTF